MAGFDAIALQLPIRSIRAADSADTSAAKILDNIAFLRRRATEAKNWIGESLKLLVTPEFLLTGFPAGHTREAWRTNACFEAGGREYELLGEIAQSLGIYLAGNAYEIDPHFPDLYFQSSYILDPAGDCILRYRRLNSMWSASPHDVWEDYLSHYGEEAIFPVANTSIGRLAAIASEEVLFPEIARALAMRGAEIFVHSSAEYSSPIGSPKETCKLARAIENTAYLVSANAAGFVQEDGSVENVQGHSLISDPEGRFLSKAGPGDQTMTYARIDPAIVRGIRSRTGMANLLSRQRFELYQSTYQNYGTWAAGGLSGARPDTSLRQILEQYQSEAISRLHGNFRN